jgi:hypothetical protein
MEVSFSITVSSYIFFFTLKMEATVFYQNFGIRLNDFTSQKTVI